MSEKIFGLLLMTFFVLCLLFTNSLYESFYSFVYIYMYVLSVYVHTHVYMYVDFCIHTCIYFQGHWVDLMYGLFHILEMLMGQSQQFT